MSTWDSPDVDLINLVDKYRNRCVEVYRHDRNRIEEDSLKESAIAEGGYGRKQIQELVQNAADAMQNQKGRIEVHLTEDALYVANQGEPFVTTGVRALLYAHLSNKSGEEIGRFGLGFKSISGVSDGPWILSRSVSFRFDRAQTVALLNEKLEYSLSGTDVPSLRMAWTVDPREVFATDEVAARLSEWATTIVKVPLKEGSAAELNAELSEFNKTFCLFVPHVTELRLHSEIDGSRRVFKTKRSGKRVTLIDADGTEQAWVVFQKEHEPSAEALEGAGRSAQRETVTVSWAVPLEGAAGIGQLSAYFPVKSETTLSGWINAPWKLSDDRINLIEGAFNSEILTEVVPQLVVAARSELISTGNFGRYLDILPARGRESRSWADNQINAPIYAALRESRSLPNANGELRSAHSLKLLPEAVPSEFHAKWLELAVDKDSWAHPQCSSSPERRSKSIRLMSNDKERKKEEESRFYGDSTAWLESFRDESQKDPQQSINAISFAGLLYNEAPGEADAIHRAEIVLLELGIWVQPITGRCFIRTSPSDKGAAFIDGRVAENKDARAALGLLNIGDYSQTGELMQTLAELKTTATGIDWDNLWSVLRQSAVSDIESAFQELFHGREAQVIRVKDASGKWELPNGQYIPGDLIQNVKADAKFLVDPVFHATDKEILQLLGIRDRPYRAMHPNTKWLKEYREEFQQPTGLSMGLSPQEWKSISFGDNTPLLGPLDSFSQLSDNNRAAISKYILSNSLRPSVVPTYRTRKSEAVIHPEYWLVKKYGLLPTTLGVARVEDCFVIDNDDQDISDIVPVITDLELTSDAREFLDYHRDMEELAAADFEGLVELHVRRDDEAAVGKTYSWWCYMNPESAPEKIHLQVSGAWIQVEPATAAVTADNDLEEELEKLGIPTLKVSSPEDTLVLSKNWNLMDASSLPTDYEYRPSGEPEKVIFRFPALQHYHFDGLDTIEVQSCESVEMTTLIEGRPQARLSVEYGMKNSVILTTGITERAQLSHILRALELDSSPEIVEQLIESSRKTESNRLRNTIRKASSDAERLLRLAGEDRLLSLIPQPAIDFLKQTNGTPPSGLQLADTCVKMFGVDALRMVCKRASDSLPVGPPPTRWNGSYTARDWVMKLGFGEKWAGEKTIERSKPNDYVDGPVEVDEFHDYQQQVSDNLRRMLSGEGPNRGLITLPTGAGKTRVAVQTIIEAIRDGIVAGPILWIVDSEELCEQAIDSWSYLWRSFGRAGTRMVISRHFTHKYNAVEETSGVQVVVATWQKLLNTIGNPDYEWLQQTPLVIIDEAHTALSRSYTRILEWVGLTHAKRDKHLLGLSATPYRGRRDSDETSRLHARFDNNILDAGVFGEEEPMAYLQKVRVLSRVTMETIESQHFISLSPKEVEDFKKRHWLPTSKEQELGKDVARTQKIIESIKSKPKDWTILVFATSVENAETLATLLTLEGIPATSISQNTPQSERELAIQRFKTGEIRVLTNYAVLAQGFDAPKTQAVYITRPTTSEVRYQQMIGRGLRGPRNGGTDQVHLVNLLDNIQEFELSIKYKPFEVLTEETSED